MGKALNEYTDTEIPQPLQTNVAPLPSVQRLEMLLRENECDELCQEFWTYLGECEGHISASLSFTGCLHSLGKRSGTAEIGLRRRMSK